MPTQSTDQGGQDNSPNENAGANGPEGVLAGEGSNDFSTFLDGPSDSKGSSAAAPTKASVPSKPAGADTTQPVVPADAGAAKPAAAVKSPAGIDPQLLEQIVSASVRGSQQGAQQQQQQQADARDLTPQEFNAKYGIVPITPNHIAQLLDQDPAKAAAALNNLFQSNLRAAVLMSKDLYSADLLKARAEYEPHIRSWQTYQEQQRETQLQNKFYATHTDLAGEKELVQEMTDAIRARVLSGQLSFKTEDEALQAVASASRKLLARMNKQSSASTASSSQTSTKGQTGQRQMTAAATAGQSGTGQTAGQSDEAAVFGNEWR